MDTSSNLAWCYRVLEITEYATEQEIKSAYKKLALKYHPDLNPSDRAKAEAHFKLISLAYQTLITSRQQVPYTHTNSYSTPTTEAPTTASDRVRFQVKHHQQIHTPESMLSKEQKLYKLSTLNLIYSLLKRKKWQQAIEVAEKLATVFPNDSKVCEWLAVAYHRWARKLIERQYYDPARIYLKKALQADPHNRLLWLAIDRDYKNMERQLRL